MPETRVLTGWNITVIEMPAVPGINDKPGRVILYRDLAEPHNAIMFPLTESIAKDVGHKLVGQGKVRTATTEEMAMMGSMIVDHTKGPRR